jgi:peptidoglycan/xylan/chitin deacetylase (PgdA/CDA1 family)
MALTFDDGPDPDFTPAVLDVLGMCDVRATFFVIGRNAAKHPDLIQKMLREGHVVANHTQDHLWLNELDRDGIQDQVIGGLTTLGAIGAQGSSMFRPPRGWTSPTVADVVNGAGLR